MVKFFRKKKRFDEDADWVPQKGRPFNMKAGTQPEDPPTDQPTNTPVFTQRVADQRGAPQAPTVSEAKPILDSEGLDKAYQQGDVYGNKNIAYVAGSQTVRDWLDDFTKIPQWQYFPVGLNPIVDIMNSVWGRAVFGTGDLRRSERYQKAYEYLKNHSEIDTLEGHSLGGDVVLQLQKDFPERHFKTITYGAPVLDLFGTQNADIGQENVLRFSNNGDLVSAFDNSALKTSHPDPGNYAPSFWHDFHNKEQAGGRIAGVSVPGLDRPGGADANYRGATPKMNTASTIDSTVKTTWDTQPFTLFNKNLIYDKTEGEKMAE